MMSIDPEHQKISDLLGAYALHAVDGDEAALVDAHLEECPRCRSELDGLEQVAADLGMLDAEDPPADLWARISDRILALGPSGVADASIGGGDGPGSGHPTLARVQHHRSRRTRTRALAGAALAAAAVITALALSLSGANARNQQLQSALAARGSQSALQSALASPAHRVVDLRSKTGTHLVELVLRANGDGYVISSSLAPLPGDETYQLWASIDGQPISVGLLGPRLHAGGAFSVGTAAQPSALMITIEPSGGVITPDQAPIATSTLT